MVCVQSRYLLQSPLFAIQFLLNMTRGYVIVSTRCNTSTRRKLTMQFNKIDVIRLHSTPSVRLNLLTSLTTCLAWLILIGKKKNRPYGALDRNTAQLSIGTAMHSGSEHTNTGREFSYPFNATSNYTLFIQWTDRGHLSSLMDRQGASVVFSGQTGGICRLQWTDRGHLSSFLMMICNRLNQTDDDMFALNNARKLAHKYTAQTHSHSWKAYNTTAH